MNVVDKALRMTKYSKFTNIRWLRKRIFLRSLTKAKCSKQNAIM